MFLSPDRSDTLARGRRSCHHVQESLELLLQSQHAGPDAQEDTEAEIKLFQNLILV